MSIPALREGIFAPHGAKLEPPPTSQDAPRAVTSRSLPPRSQPLVQRLGSPLRYLLTLLACLALAGLLTPLRESLDLANIVMLFLLLVFLVALWLGRGPAVLGAVLSVALFDFFIVPPHLSFIPADIQFLITLGVMLTVALVTAQQTAGLGQQALQAETRERQTQDLFILARRLAGASSRDQVADALHKHLDELGLDAHLWLPTPDAPLPQAPDRVSDNLLQETMARNEVRAPKIEGQPLLLIPLYTPLRRQGVMLVGAPGVSNPARRLEAQRPLLTALASLLAIALERLEYADIVQDTRLEIESERLRNSVLSALSHDLRTPLTVMIGLADSLVLSREPMGDAARDAAHSLLNQARALSSLLTNLLDMAKLKSGRVKLHREWHLVDDLIAAALRLLRPTLQAHPVRLRLGPDLPLVEFDAVLMERVICNLLENAARYAPPDTPIEIRAEVDGPWARIEVCDQGPGFPAGDPATLFDPFVRGRSESATPGAGLGLAICHTIIDAHGGRIAITNRSEGGACVALRIPLGNPPEIDDEADLGEESGP